MTQSTSHRRSPSAPHTKSKSSRPGLHRRGTSTVVSISKLGAGSGHSRGAKDDDEFDMAASFLNFCAMCENQITVPNNSILYCSESCRRKDSCKPLSASMPSMTNMSSMTTTPPHSPPLSPRTIVAPMTPTRPIPGIRIPDYMHDGKSDLDPTEWKPVLLSTRSSTSLASSDAWNYLSKFHGGNETLLARRAARSSASLPALVGGAGATGAHVPSLTHTPSTVASSFSSTASDDLGSMYEVASGPAQRPLPPRHNPYFGSMTAAHKSKGVDLVVPHMGHDDVPVEVVDSTDVWEDAHERAQKTAPISMVRGGGSARVQSA
ncbi:hypothetical protein N7451_000392 [Penicillium sp. IBT 35674x]|nr:hypothetical protein N7451_000392 [Penicillium sp. IBT 35674x]